MCHLVYRVVCRRILRPLWRGEPDNDRRELAEAITAVLTTADDPAISIEAKIEDGSLTESMREALI